jgi:D-3-phosphoglycerate dehydrogenase
MVRIAVTTRSFSRHPALRAELLKLYPHVSFHEDAKKLEGQALIKFLKGHEKAITGLEKLDDSVFSAVPELRIVSKYGVGIDMIDLIAMARHGVKLGWKGGINRRSVAELTICFMIAALRHVPSDNRSVREAGWQRPIGKLLSARTVGIIGCGHVGKDLALLLRAFGCRVLAHDLLDFPEFYAAHGVKPLGLENLLRESDIVTVHVPLDRTTRGLLTAERLALMKKGAILVNAARGGIVDEAALKAMLKDGRLAAAAFDVFASEPPTDMELLTLPNFLATSHIGGNSEETVFAMGMQAISGLEENRVPGNGWPENAGV